ncbi:MAG: hypothetical protein IJ341_08060 [Bacteroidales bacterium]|nr:hypothetical protein [Bacteroidales bacterium]
MILNLNYEKDREVFHKKTEEYLSSRCTIELTKKHGQRTLSQNSYLHLILGWFANEYGCTLDEVKVRFFKRKVNPNIFLKEGKRGDYVLRSSKELTTKEMTDAIDRFRNWSASEAGIYLPSPNETEFLSHIQREITNNKYI